MTNESQLADYLLRKGVVTPSEIEFGLQEQKVTEGRLAQILERCGFITEDELLQAQRAGEEKAIESLKSKMARYDKEKAEISEKAKGLEKQRDDSRAAATRSSAKDERWGSPSRSSRSPSPWARSVS